MTRVNFLPVMFFGVALLATRPALAQTINLCDQNPASFPTVNIPNDATKTYVVQSNFWNAAAAGGRQCLTVDQPTGRFTIASPPPGPTATNGAPSSYPSIFKGCHWGNCTNNSGLPLQFPNIGTANVFWSINAKTTGQWNAAIDFWFNRTSTTGGQPNGAEIMIWLNHLGQPQPVGGPIAQVTINGIAWTLWEGALTVNGVTWNVVSYVRVPPATSLGTAAAPMDVKPFFNDALARGFIQNTWWLIAAEAGFEPWMSGDGLASTGFAATFSAGTGGGGGGGGGGNSTLSVTKNGSGAGTVISSPFGINCGGTCSAPFATGSRVTLTQGSGAGSTFGGWSAAGCPGNAPCTVTLNASQTVNATFNSVNPVLTVTRAGTGAGTVTSTPAAINCGAMCSAGFASGASVSLMATPAAGSTFAGWSGACTGTGACTVSMTQARSVTATFNGSVTGGCTVTATPIVAQNSPFFHEQQLRIDNTGTLTALSVQVVVQRTTGVSFSGQYHTFNAPMQQTNGSTAAAVTYTFTLAAGQSIGASTGRFVAAQSGGTGTPHPTAGDTYAVAGNCGGRPISLTGHF